MLKLRLARVGRHNSPDFRIVAIDSRIKRDGGYKHLIGKFNPITKKYSFDKEKTISLLLQGAQPSETIYNELKKEGIWSEYLVANQKQSKKGSKENKRPISAKAKAKKEANKNKPKEEAKAKTNVTAASVEAEAVKETEAEIKEPELPKEE